MKKNKYVLRSVRKQKISFLIYNLLTYVIIFTVVGMVTMIAVDNYFYRGAKNEIEAEVKKMDQENYVFKHSGASYRKVIVYFSEDGKLIDSNAQILIPKRIITRTEGVIRVETLKDEEGDTHHYLTFLKRVTHDEYAYAKIYINVDGETSARSMILRVYAICVASMFVLSVGASLLLSQKTIKPIVSSLEKQFNFVSDASHELRTPLAIVQSKIENILTDSEKTVYEVSEDLAISLKELNRLTKLTSDLLVLARGDNQTMRLELEPTNMDQLVQTAIEPFRELAEIQEKTFTYMGDNVTCRVDKNQIYQVMIILLDNALIYTNPKDSVAVRLFTTPSEVVLEVADTGIGTSPETKAHLFERFYREDKARSRATGGNGLGLSIAKTIVQYHHGKIFVEDNKPKGTKFVVVLPRGKSM